MVNKFSFHALIFLVVTPTLVSAQSFTLGFPIAINGVEQNPYTAPIITVLDHSADYFYDPSHTEVIAYTGEMGKGRCSPSGLTQPPCGYYNPNFVPQDDSNLLEFILNGDYVGYASDCETAKCTDQAKVLNYRGHSGYDYGYGANTTIVAANDGDLYVPAYDPINNPGSNTPSPSWYDPWCDFHTFYIRDPTTGWSTWYLHVSSLTVGPPSPPHRCTVGTNGLNSNISADQFIAHVKKGDPVALVGNWAYGHTGGVGYHLHFEVRRSCQFLNGIMQSCMVVDPYGWEWPGSGDPIAQNTCWPGNVLGQALCATPQASPLWSLGDWGLQQPVVNSISLSPSNGGYSATILGQNFAPGALIGLWSVQGQYLVSSITPISVTNTQIVAQLPNPPLSDPGQFVLKVKNPLGPRSLGVVLALSVSSSSAALLLDGTPAPGGGTIVSFGGFWSFNDRNEGVVSVGVDTSGDGIADYFADFEYSAGQLLPLTAPGFNQISSVTTHVLLNNNRDMAFASISSATNSPSAIYLLTSSSSSPNQITAVGQSCPAPCPISGPQTVSALTGPLAFSDTGRIVFSATLLNSQTQTSSCCFLFLYSATDGSTVKVVSDGPTGDATPIGGTFAAGALSDPLSQITSDGDVIFGAQVSGSSSSGGIFRFSRTTGLSKLVVQGDKAPSSVGGNLGYPLFGRTGSVSGRQLVFHVPVSGGSGNQAIGVVKDVTASPAAVTVVAYQGEATGTVANGVFSSPFNQSQLPFGYFGENTAPPCVRSDGKIVFYSLLSGAQAATGAATTEGLFIWDGTQFQKIVVDGDPVTSGGTVQGVFAPAVNDLGEVLYFAASVQ